MLLRTFESFQLDVRLGSNVFNKSWKTIGKLAIKGWWSNLWEYCNYLGVQFKLDHYTPPARKQDLLLMDCFWALMIYTIHLLLVLKWCACNNKVNCLFNNATIDQKSIDPRCLGDSIWKKSTISFNVEMLRPTDFLLLTTALHNLSSESPVFLYQL